MERKKICIYQNKEGKLYMPEDLVNIQKDYREALDEVLSFFNKMNYKNIHSIYLRGSVVFGLGKKGFSDIDFFILTYKQMSDFDRSVIKNEMDKLNKKYNFITKFDFGYFILDKFFSMKENVLIKLTSICIYGDDIKSKINTPSTGRDVTISLSLLESEIAKTRREIKIGLYDESNTKNMCVWIMKRIVRSGLEIVSTREGCFTRDLGLCFEKFSKYYPDKNMDMSKALELALNPTNDTLQIEIVFDTIGEWIIEEGKRLKLI